MKLLIASDHIGQDGTGRFLTYLANEMTKAHNFDVELLLFHDEDNAFNQLLNPNVKIITLGLKTSIRKSIYSIYKAIVARKPDICMFGYTQLLVFGYLTPLFHRYGIKVLFRDTIIPSIYHKNNTVLHNLINKHAYHRFDHIIAQSDDMRNDLIENWGCQPEKLTKINNPVDVAEIQGKSEGDCPEELKNKRIPTLVAAGRLDDQKGYDIIISRMAKIKRKYPFRLLIMGRGPLESQIRKQIADSNLESYIDLLGFRTNVAQYIKHSDGLLLSSRYEGFPNIVLEALALGKPVFTNTCPGGINEIIIKGVNGIACDFNDQEAFEEGLAQFLATEYNSEMIVANTKERYQIEYIMSKYKSFYERI